MAIIRIFFGFWYWSSSLQSRLLSGKIQVRLYTQYFKSYRPPLPSVSVISKQLFYVVKRQYYTSELLFALYCIIVCMIFSRDPQATTWVSWQSRTTVCFRDTKTFTSISLPRMTILEVNYLKVCMGFTPPGNYWDLPWKQLEPETETETRLWINSHKFGLSLDFKQVT